MHLLDDVRSGADQHLVAALERLATEVSRGQLGGLEAGSHAAVQHDDTLAQPVEERVRGERGQGCGSHGSAGYGAWRPAMAPVVGHVPETRVWAGAGRQRGASAGAREWAAPSLRRRSGGCTVAPAVGPGAAPSLRRRSGVAPGAAPSRPRSVHPRTSSTLRRRTPQDADAPRTAAAPRPCPPFGMSTAPRAPRRMCGLGRASSTVVGRIGDAVAGYLCGRCGGRGRHGRRGGYGEVGTARRGRRARYGEARPAS